MDEVRKLQRITDEEDRGVVPHKIIVSLLRIELDGETPRVAFSVGRSLLPTHSREAYEDLGALAHFREGFGFGVPCHIVGGSNKLIAKIAADANKPDGLTIVEPEYVKIFLDFLPVSRLPGVGKKTSQKMSLLGIKTIGDLAKYDIQRLIDSFGRNLGLYYHNSANGLNNELVREPNEADSISRISTLKENTRELSVLLEKLIS